MIRSLHISHYVLIDSLDISFPEGLVIITGQTGAGKSILLGALSLLKGGKADAAAISEGEDCCVVEAMFESDGSGGIREKLEGQDIEWNPEELVIRRVVYRSGRSRCFVNDSPVNVQLLGEISEKLVDIHSQHKSLLLTDSEFQMNVLDHYAGAGQKVSECRDAWRKLNAIRKELETDTDRLSQIKAEHDYNQQQFTELESAGLREGEIEELELEQKALSNAESIREALESAFLISRPQDNIGERIGISSSLKEMRRQLEHAAKFLPQMDAICERLESAKIEIDDITDEIEAAAEKVCVSGERLAQVEERLSLLYSLLRKHSCSTIGELCSLRDEYSEALYGGYELENKVERLEKELKAQKEIHLGICKELSSLRVAAAPKLGKEITDSLQYLELERAVFEVRTERTDPGATGIDRISFMFSAGGTTPSDISKCASGGEISRIMLSLKSMMAGHMNLPTMIFDEIDSGVSGSVAAKMGSMICRMGKMTQVFAITHLPQVAAKGDAHYLVSKRFNRDTGRASSGIRLIEGEERIQEIARMLSSEKVTPEAVANARILISG